MDYIVSKIKDLIKRKELSASEFADKIGVKRATLSHVLSGRNKPSLEFVLGILNTFEDVSPDELLFATELRKSNDYDSTELSQPNTIDLEEKESKHKLKTKEIDRIVIFYKDHSFTEYQNSNDS